MKVFKRGSSLLTVIVLVTILSALLLTTFMVVSFYINMSNRSINRAKDWKGYFEIIEEVADYFEEETDIGEDATSPFDGWYSDLPEEVGDFKISYYAEDSKIDINHIEMEPLKKQGYFKKYKKSPDYFLTEELVEDLKKANKKDLTGDEEEEESIFDTKSFFGNDSSSKKKEDDTAASSDKNKANAKDATDDAELYPTLFSIYMVPNLNTAQTDKIKGYLELWNLKAEEAHKRVSSQVERMRSKNKEYLKAKGLLVDKSKYNTLRITSFDRTELDRFYMLLDYEGTINLNLVEEDVFKLAVILCNEKAQPTAYWKKIMAARKKETTIKNIKEIFGKDYKLYEKMFSVKSKLFKVVIEKDKRTLTVLIRKYKDFRNRPQVEILRTFVGKVKPEEKKDNLSEPDND